jgi:hypothetical protein
MKRIDLDWGYVLSFFSVATVAALVPAACSEPKAPRAVSPSETGGAPAASGGAGSEDAGSAGREAVGGEPGDDAAAGMGGSSDAGAAGAGSGGMEPTCAEPTLSCDDTCVDVSSSREHCGSCDHPCTGSDACVQGECTARSWGVPVSSAGFDQFNPIVQLGSDGRAFVVAQSFNAKAMLKVSVIGDAGPIPGFAQEVAGLTHAENIAEFRFAMNRKGQGVVAFISSGAIRKLYASYFDGEELADPVLLDDSGLGIGSSPYIDGGFSLMIEDDGVANVVYRRYQLGSAGAEDLYVVATPGFGEAWNAPVPMDQGTDSVTEHHVASSGTGRLLATWAQGGKIFVSTRDYGTWADPTPLSDQEQVAKQPRVAMTPDGKAMAVFILSIGQENGVYRASFDGNAWSTAELLAGSDHQEEYPAVALRADGSGLFGYKLRGGAGEDDRVFVVPFESATALNEAKELSATPIVAQAPRANNRHSPAPC